MTALLKPRAGKLAPPRARSRPGRRIPETSINIEIKDAFAALTKIVKI